MSYKEAKELVEKVLDTEPQLKGRTSSLGRMSIPLMLQNDWWHKYGMVTPMTNQTNSLLWIIPLYLKLKWNTENDFSVYEYPQAGPFLRKQLELKTPIVLREDHETVCEYIEKIFTQIINGEGIVVNTVIPTHKLKEFNEFMSS